MGMTRRVALAATVFVVFGCEQSAKSPSPTTDKVPAQATPSPASAAPGEPAPGTASPDTAQVVEKAPPPKLYDKPVERRLYSDRIEASSFLWTDWNKFQENYHPSYVMDGDPTTAWVEGADASGAGEWVRIHLSPIEGATSIRLRLQNGYHKSKSLHAKNARLRSLEIRALPSRAAKVVELADNMEWQEVTFDLPSPGRVEALELEAKSVFEGSKYTDLCVSDVEVFVTGLNVENPAFEKNKLDELLAWKKNRLAAAKLLSGTKAAELPIRTGYRVVDGAEVTGHKIADGKPHPSVRRSLAAVPQYAGPAVAALAQRASASLENGFDGWVTVQVVARDPIELPDVDGLRAATGEELVYGPPDDAFVLPASQQGVLLRSSHLSAFDTKGKNPLEKTKCKEGASEYMRPPRKPGGSPVLEELLLVRCVTEETREGEATYMTWQLLEFDPEGNLVLIAAPWQTVQWLEWQKGEKGTVVAGGGRIKGFGEPLDRLEDARVVARD